MILQHWEAAKWEHCDTLYDVLDDRSRCAVHLKKVPGHILDKYRDWTVANVGTARELLNNFSFFGLTEHYLASLCLLYYTFRDEERFAAVCANGTEARVQAVPRRNKKDPRFNYSETARVDSKLRQLSARVNAKDWQLYATAETVFRQRVAAMERETGVAGLLPT
jgi:hypothetical protein